MAHRGPAIILARPQLGENIGASARAMWNCGIDDLRLVAPRDGWPNAKARAAATGALQIVDRARVFATVEDAIADLGFVVATSARLRDMVDRGIELDDAMIEAHRQRRLGSAVGFLFGPERTGLDNDDLTLASRTLRIPLNPRFQSLNLAQAVLLVSWTWMQAGDSDDVAAAAPDEVEPTEPSSPPLGSVPQGRAGSRAADVPLADGESLANFFHHMEQELDKTRFFRVPERRTLMIRKLRAIFQRADLRETEVQTLHGVLSALVGRRKDGRPVGGPKATPGGPEEPVADSSEADETL